jgi:hypothetical protein
LTGTFNVVPVKRSKLNPQTTGADLGGAPAESQGRPILTVDEPCKPPCVLTGKPSVAANNGADIPKKLLRAFEAADVSGCEWLRLPSPRARCRLSSMSRTTLNEAIERGDIRAITVRQPGATRGIKLINRASLVAWLARLDAEQNGQQPSKQREAGR